MLSALQPTGSNTEIMNSLAPEGERAILSYPSQLISAACMQGGAAGPAAPEAPTLGARSSPAFLSLVAVAPT